MDIGSVRKAVIEYVSYVASGIHSGIAETDEEKTIDLIRRSAYFSNNTLNFDARGVFAFPSPSDDPPFAYSPEAIDVLLWELLSAVYYIISSDDTA